jgi:ubiquitin-like 1-activating enzyme E1 B
MVFEKVYPLSEGYCSNLGSPVPKVFNADIKNLLIMADMWRSRSPPVPLNFDKIMNGSFVLRPEQPEHANGTDSNGASGSKTFSQQPNGQAKGLPNGTAPAASAVLKDQRALSLRDSLSLFVARYEPRPNSPYWRLTSFIVQIV